MMTVPARQPSTRRVVLAATCAAAALSLATFAACARPHYLVAQQLEALTTSVPGDSLTKNIVLISIDGLRPDAIATFGAARLQQMMEEGSYSLSASTILPSKTLPSHTSMLTGEPPERHGVLWNDVASAEADIIEIPTIFSVARSHGYRTAAFFSKAKFNPLQRPGTLDYSQAPGGWFGRWSADRTVTDVEKYLTSAKPNLLFVHLSDPDRAGHDAGWMSASYGRAVLGADAALARILDAAERAYGAGNYSAIVTADHGGHDRDHGTSDPRDVTIPWIAWGRGVRGGAVLDASIRTMDTASTVLWMLGLEEPTDWLGTPIRGAFDYETAE